MVQVDIEGPSHQGRSSAKHVDMVGMTGEMLNKVLMVTGFFPNQAHFPTSVSNFNRSIQTWRVSSSQVRGSNPTEMWHLLLVVYHRTGLKICRADVKLCRRFGPGQPQLVSCATSATRHAFFQPPPWEAGPDMRATSRIHVS